MDMEFLRRLHTALTDDNAIFKTGLNLCELYQNIEDVDAADRDFTNAIDAAELPFQKADSIIESVCALTMAYDLQGFVNGFQLAMRIATGKAVG